MAAVGGLGLLVPAVGRAQLVTTIVDPDGASFPCVTVGPLAPIAQEYCVRRSLAQGAVRKSELGWSGLEIGVNGAQDGVVTAVRPGSPAAAAGIVVGDAVVSVDGTSVHEPAPTMAERQTFGARGATLSLTLRRNGQTLQRSFSLAPAPPPADTPTSPTFLVGMHPVVNWRGRFVPCMGAGLLGPAVVAACVSHFTKLGFVQVSELGGSGLAFDPRRPDAAVIATVAPGSPAAAADVRPGDVVTGVNGAPLAFSLGKAAQAALFGKAGERRRVVFVRNGRTLSADLVLAPS